MPGSTEARPPLFTTAFFLLCLINFLAFCNLSIFYGFYGYLEHLGLPAAWRGPLLALEPLAALALRPVISPLLTAQNSVRVLALGLTLVTAALAGYALVTAPPALAFVRCLHGAGFVTLATALLALFTRIIPRERSGQAFGVFTLTTLVPYAVMPPLMETLAARLADQGQAYAAAAPLMLAALALLPVLGRHCAATAPQAPAPRPGWREIRQGLAAPAMWPLFGAGLLLFSATTMVFFFAKGAALALGATDPALFFLASTGANIGVRAFGNTLYDKCDKPLVLALGLFALAGTMAAMPAAPDMPALLWLAGGYGLALGVTMPMASATVFEACDPGRRALYSNLFMSTMDAGFFLGPLAGGWLAGNGYAPVFLTAAALTTGAGALASLASRRMPPAAGRGAASPGPSPPGGAAPRTPPRGHRLGAADA